MCTTYNYFLQSRSSRTRRNSKCSSSCNPGILPYYTMSILLLHLNNNPHHNQHISKDSNIRYTRLFRIVSKSLLLRLGSSQLTHYNISSELNSGTLYSMIYYTLHNHYLCTLSDLFFPKLCTFHHC